MTLDLNLSCFTFSLLVCCKVLLTKMNDMIYLVSRILSVIRELIFAADHYVNNSGGHPIRFKGSRELAYNSPVARLELRMVRCVRVDAGASMDHHKNIYSFGNS